MAFRVGSREYECVINWKLMVFYTVFMPLFLGLGYWQLNRAEEKAQLQASFNARMAAEPIRLEQANDPAGYEKVSFSGRFDARYHVLLDNRTHQGRPGYEVISPFVLDETTYVRTADHLIGVDYVWLNRGWVSMGRSRTDLPRIDSPQGRLVVEGITDTGSGQGILLKDTAWSGSWPKLIQRIDIPRMAEHLAKEQPGVAFPVLVRLAADSPGALVPIWKPVTMSAQKHLGYALQWFSMSAALTILYFFATIKRVRH